MENSIISVSIRALIELDPQTFSRFSLAYQPLIRRFAAGYPQYFRQGLRYKSTAFPRVFHIGDRWIFPHFFRSDCAGISRRGNEEKGRNRSERPELRKTGPASRRSQVGDGFSAEIQNWPLEPAPPNVPPPDTGCGLDAADEVGSSAGITVKSVSRVD